MSEPDLSASWDAWAEQKRCQRCEKWKPPSSFKQRTDSKSLDSWCIDCRREYNRNYRRTLPALCWCGSQIVRLTKKEVADGVTHSCRRNRCAP